MRSRMLVALAGIALLVPCLASGRVVKFVITQRRVLANGMSFGKAGPYERLDGIAYMEVDPHDPLNAVIVDLDKALRNARGMVEFSSPFIILKPIDMAKGNHKIWYGVNNRGNIIELNWRAFPPVPTSNDPLTAADVGNNLFLELGYTFVDAGWEGNVIPNNHRLAPTLPVARNADGSPIVGLTRVEYPGTGDFAAPVFTSPLEGASGASFTSYETADTDTTHSTLTMRDTETAPRVPIPSNQWAFGKCPTGQASLVPTTTDICLFNGFQLDKVYELVYPAKNPIVQGLGYAVTRDIASFLRYETHDDVGNPNPLAASGSTVGIRRCYGSGTSSTGMYMRDWLYLGFNEDEAHRNVFDAVQIAIPGTHRGLFNVRFSDPNIWSNQDHSFDFVSNSYPPQTFAVRTDPISGIRDGILKRPATDPLVFQIDTSNEFWNMMASLNAVDGLGHPVRIPRNVRMYFLSSTAHLGATGLFSLPAGAKGICDYATANAAFITAAYAPTLRALVVALDRWADKGIEPPPSNYPRLENGTLVSQEEAAEGFPNIPGVSFPTSMNVFHLLNFGPQFNSEGGIETILPPELGPSYENLIPLTDRNGLDVAGVRAMEIRAPIGTSTGWNVRAPGHRAPDLCGLNGSFFPFATTKAERIANGDPRMSLQERYTDHQGYVRAVRRAARELRQNGFLLQEDAQAWIKAAEASNILK